MKSEGPRHLSSWIDGPKGQQAPRCTQCGDSVRRPDSVRPLLQPHHVGFPPWNAGWDGRCESCGYQYQHEASSEFFGVSQRRVIVRPGNKVISQLDSALVVAGVQIDVIETETSLAGEKRHERVSTIFMTRDELSDLVVQLNGDLAPVLEQWSWDEDWT